MKTAQTNTDLIKNENSLKKYRFVLPHGFRDLSSFMVPWSTASGSLNHEPRHQDEVVWWSKLVFIREDRRFKTTSKTAIGTGYVEKRDAIPLSLYSWVYKISFNRDLKQVVFYLFGGNKIKD